MPTHLGLHGTPQLHPTPLSVGGCRPLHGAMTRTLPLVWLVLWLWSGGVGGLAVAFGSAAEGAAYADRGLNSPADAAARLLRRLEGVPSELERRLFADATDGRWQKLSLLSAGLIASGVDRPERLSHYEAKFADLVAELRRSNTVVGTPRQQARTIFEFLHSRVLRGGYRLECTEMTVALDDGRFNCVSASVLFNCLAGRFGLRTCGLEGNAHAMSRLILADATMDLETTCPDWFQRLAEPPRQPGEAERAVVADRVAGGGPRPRVVTDVELVSTIYYNRGVGLLAQKQFAEAMAANAKAMRLDPQGTSARGNLLAGINNWAIDLSVAGRWDEAAELLRQGLSLDPGSRILEANFVHVYRQWTDALCREGRFDQALAALDLAGAVRPDESQLTVVRREVTRRWETARRQSDQDGPAMALGLGLAPSGSLPTGLPISADGP
jgi:tetratricopeptide (TPR) repeat protein